MNRPWEPIDDGHWGDYRGWESWLIEQIPSEEAAEQICEIPVVVLANLYCVFCELFETLEEVK